VTFPHLRSSSCSVVLLHVPADNEYRFFGMPDDVSETELIRISAMSDLPWEPRTIIGTFSLFAVSMITLKGLPVLTLGFTWKPSDVISFTMAAHLLAGPAR
jgi:hypothetical protein